MTFPLDLSMLTASCNFYGESITDTMAHNIGVKHRQSITDTMAHNIGVKHRQFFATYWAHLK